MYALDRNGLNAIFGLCEMPDGNLSKDIDCQEVEGPQNTYKMSIQKAYRFRQEITDMLDQVTVEFELGIAWVSVAKGRSGRVWGTLEDAEKLIVLGIMVDAVVCCFPKHLWKTLPGNYPIYRLIKVKQMEENES